MSNKFTSFKDSLRQAFIAYGLVPVAVVFTLLFVLFSVYVFGMLHKNNQRNNQIVSAQLEEYLSYYVSAADTQPFLPELLHVLEGGSASELYHQLYQLSNHALAKCDFYLSDANGNIQVSSTTKIPEYLQPENRLMWGILRWLRDNPESVRVMHNRSTVSEYGSYFTVGAAVRDGSHVIGYLTFNIPHHTLNKTVSDLDHSVIVVTDNLHSVCLSSSTAYINPLGKLREEYRRDTNGTYKINGDLYRISVAHNKDLGFRVYAILPLQMYVNSLKLAVVSFLALLVMLVYSMNHLAHQIAVEKTQSIDAVLQGIRQVQSGNLDTVITVCSNDEFREIAETYNEATAAIKTLVEQKRQEAIHTALAEIKQLESQFKPHFLYNTLENIRCLIRLDPKAAEATLVNLASLLRYSIRNPMENVKLAEDITYLNSYFEILTIRFGDKLRYLIEIQAGAESETVPKLLIQPAIENAIQYAFGERGSLFISIQIVADNHHLRMTIADDGVGIEPALLAQVRSQLQSECPNQTNHSGLYNIHRRIHLMYGPPYGLTIDSQVGQGTTVTICLPISSKEGEPFA